MLRKAIASALALVFCGLLAGCDSTVCEEAVTKLEGECGLGSGAAVPLQGSSQECETDKTQGTFSECAAGCVLDYPCEDITDKNQDPNKNGYADCLGDCQK